MFRRAKVFRELGYPVVIFKDSDINEQQQAFIQEATLLNIQMFEWGNSLATEQAIFNSCPLNIIPLLLNIAVERKGEDAVNAHIQNASEQQFNLAICTQHPNDNHRQVLGGVSKSKEWFKDIEPMEKAASHVLWPNRASFVPAFRQIIESLFSWSRF